MAIDLTLPVETTETTTKTENVTMEIREYTGIIGDSTSESVLVIVLGAKDAEGNWRTDIEPVLVRHVGAEADEVRASLFDLEAVKPACKARLEKDAEEVAARMAAAQELANEQ